MGYDCGGLLSRCDGAGRGRSGRNSLTVLISGGCDSCDCSGCVKGSSREYGGGSSSSDSEKSSGLWRRLG